MKNENELVSVIIPMYNAKNYIRYTLESVINQTYTNLEIIVVDDSSSDNSIQIVQKYNDKRIKLIKLKQNQGVANARNIGIENATGKYIAFIDSDDLWKKDKISKQLKKMKECKSPFSFTSYEIIDSIGNVTRKKVNVPLKTSYKQLLLTNVIACSTVMLYKPLLDNIRFENMNHEDYILWLRISKQNSNIYILGLNEILISYRKHNESISHNKLKSAQWVWNIYRNIEHLSLFYSLYCFVHYAINGLKKHL